MNIPTIADNTVQLSDNILQDFNTHYWQNNAIDVGVLCRSKSDFATLGIDW